jgi:Cu/Ag efflux pump CusA
VLLVAALVAAALALAGLLLAARSALSSERLLLAEYEALGVARTTLSRSTQLRLLALTLLGVGASLAGAVLAAFASGGAISLGSIVGLLAVLGIAARSSLLLVDRGPAAERLAPLLASAVAIIAALAPMIVFGPIPGLELVQPTAIVVIGGLVASVLFNLFVLPALCLVIGPGERSDPDAELAVL